MTIPLWVDRPAQTTLVTLTIIPRPTVGGYESDIFSAYRIASTRNTKRNERQLYRPSVRLSVY